MFGTKRAECPDCRTVLKGSLALISHQGSRPCKLEQTLQKMEARRWKCAGNLDAERILRSADAEYEQAPAVYRAGNGTAAIAKEKKQHRRRRFSLPTESDGIWAPAWAVTVVDAAGVGLSLDDRVRIIEWCQEEARHIDEMLAAIALGGIEVLGAYASTGARALDDERAR